jgi:hypothetical protein
MSVGNPTFDRMCGFADWKYKFIASAVPHPASIDATQSSTAPVVPVRTAHRRGTLASKVHRGVLPLSRVWEVQLVSSYLPDFLHDK